MTIPKKNPLIISPSESDDLPADFLDIPEQDLIQKVASEIAHLSNLWRTNTVKLKANDPGVQALAKLVGQNEGNGGLGFRRILESGGRTFDLGRKSMAEVTVQLANQARRISAFLYLFIHLSGAMSGHGQSLENLALQNLSTAPRDTGWGWWFRTSLTFDRQALQVLRDWLACFGVNNQSESFEARVWRPSEDMRSQIETALNKREKWSDGDEWSERMREVGDFLGILCKAIAFPVGVEEGDHQEDRSSAEPDSWGTPNRLRLMANCIRDAGRVITTKELRAKLRQDPGVILSRAKGCSEEAFVWARRHLKQGRNKWKWNPPSLPSGK